MPESTLVISFEKTAADGRKKSKEELQLMFVPMPLDHIAAYWRIKEAMVFPRIEHGFTTCAIVCTEECLDVL